MSETTKVSPLENIAGGYRIAMAFAIAGIFAKEGLTMIKNTACVATFYPTFSEPLQEITNR